MALSPDEVAAKALGWAMPEGFDLIKDGDDAIRQNGVRAWGYVEGFKLTQFRRGTPFAGTNFDLYVLVEHAGYWSWTTSRAPGLLGLPEQYAAEAGGILVLAGSSNVTTQIYVPRGNNDLLIRSVVDITTKEMTPWEPLSPFGRKILTAGTDLNAVLSPRIYQVTASKPVLNGPFDGSYSLEVIPIGTSWRIQRATNDKGEQRTRVGIGSTGETWQPWGRGGSGAGGSAATGAESRTAMEIFGYYTSHLEENEYLDSLAQHREVTRMTIGSTVQGKPIYAFRVGDPTKPTVLIASGQHGNEPGSREGALIFGRDLAQALTMATYDLCVIVIPTINVDGLLTSRYNGNGVNLNRDWVAREEPETQAVAALLAQYNVIAAVDAHSGGYARQVSLRESEGAAAKPAVLERSLRLFNGVMDMYTEAGYNPRRYSDEEVSDDPVIMRNGLAQIDDIPVLLLEVPAQWANGEYSVNPYWQATAARKCFQEVLDIVWRERAEFIAAKIS